MNFRAIKNVVEVECRRIQQEPSLCAVQYYTSSGGGMVKKSWRTVGFFLENTAEQRLVYEILLVPLRKVCVLRVYWEQPLTVLYARKFSTRANEPSVALHEASRIFVASAGEIRTSLGDSERMSGMIGKMPKSIQSLLTKVLVPVPPPVDLEAIQDAEPTSPDDVANRSAPEK